MASKHKSKKFMPVLITAVLAAGFTAFAAWGHYRAFLAIPVGVEIENMQVLYRGIATNLIVFILASLTVWSWLSWRRPITRRIAAAFVVALLLAWLWQLFLGVASGTVQILFSVFWVGWLLYLLYLVLPNQQMHTDQPMAGR